MAFKGLIITEGGRKLLAQAHLGSGLVFSSIKVGDGSVNIPYDKLHDLSNTLYRKDPVMHRKDDKILLEVDITSNDADGYYFREIGIYAKDSTNKEVLYAYDNADEDAEYIVPVDSGITYQKRLQFAFQVSNDLKVSVSTEGILYALQADLEAMDQKKLDKGGNSSETTVNFLVSSKREIIKTGETLASIFGKIAKWLTDLHKVAFTGSYNDLKDVPDQFSPAAHEHNVLDITDFPETMKNPESIVIKVGGGSTEETDQFTYDGSTKKIIDIPLYYTDSEVDDNGY